MLPHYRLIGQSLSLKGVKGVKGAILLDLHNKQLFLSRNVTFHENVLPYSKSQPLSKWHYISQNYTETHSQINQLATDPMPNQSQNSTQTTPATSISTETTNTDSLSSLTEPEPSTHTETESVTVRRSTRERQQPSHLSEYICNSLSVHHAKQLSPGSSYPISHFHSFSALSESQQKFFVSLSSIVEPQSYDEACRHDYWNDAMKNELDALKLNETWEIVDLPPNVKPFGRKWVYKVKHKVDGSIERCKARLVAKGYNQLEGLDFFDTFSPVAKLTSIRVLLDVASMKQWFLHQLDVNNAFLHGELKEDVYMEVLKGCMKSTKSSVQA